MDREFICEIRMRTRAFVIDLQTMGLTDSFIRVPPQLIQECHVLFVNDPSIFHSL